MLGIVSAMAMTASVVPAAAFAEDSPFSGYVLMNVPYSAFYGADTAEICDVDAVSSATNKTGITANQAALSTPALLPALTLREILPLQAEIRTLRCRALSGLSRLIVSTKSRLWAELKLLLTPQSPPQLSEEVRPHPAHFTAIRRLRKLLHIPTMSWTASLQTIWFWTEHHLPQARQAQKTAEALMCLYLTILTGVISR